MNEREIAAEAFALLGTARQTASLAARAPGLDLAMAYRASAELRRLREEAGERVVGRKIGFTNRTIWAEYQVFAPIWNYVWDSTLFELGDLSQPFSLQTLSEPRLEPEIVLGFGRAPEAGMDIAALADCLDWVAHGFEIVQSLFPGWRFTPAETVAAYGLHGALLVGPRRRVQGAGDPLVAALADFEIELFRDGVSVDIGKASNVLDGPLHALHHLVELLAADPDHKQVTAGEVVTTGTLTRAFPIAPGESWSTELRGIGLPGATIRFG